MDRRELLAGVAAGLAATAGCVGSGGSGDPATDSPSPTATPTPEPPEITATSLERRECREKGDATVGLDGSTVWVEGCIVGKDGCQVPVLDETAYDPEADELTVVVGTESDGSDVCTQQLTSLGYRAEVTFDRGAPGTVTVVHDGARGRRQVASERATE